MPEQETGEAITPVETQTKKRILLVEDDEPIRKFGERILSREHDVVLVENGQEAWEKLDKPEVEFDLVITDKDMPELDGVELIQKIRESDKEPLKQIPVVMMSGRLSPEIQKEVQELGAQTIKKPFGVEDFKTAVKSALETSPPGATKSS